MERKCKKCYMPIGATQIECPNCGASNLVTQDAYTGGNGGMVYAPSPESYPMLWFKFVIYFQLFAGAVLNALSGFYYLNGTSYGEDAELFYQLSPALKSADTFYAIALFIAAIFSLVVRFRLAGFHSDGPKLYLVLLGAHILLPLIYAIMISGVEPIVIEAMYPYFGQTVYEFNAWPSVLGGMVSSGILLICNAVYFNKRSELFIY